MTVDQLINALCPGASQEEKSVKRKEISKEIQQVCRISQPAVWKWFNTNKIPADRAVEIVKYYKLNPAILMK